MDERHAQTFSIVSVSILHTVIRFCNRFNVLLMVFALVSSLDVIRDQNQFYFYLWDFATVEVNSICLHKQYRCKAFVLSELLISISVLNERILAKKLKFQRIKVHNIDKMKHSCILIMVSLRTLTFFREILADFWLREIHETKYAHHYDIFQTLMQFNEMFSQKFISFNREIFCHFASICCQLHSRAFMSAMRISSLINAMLVIWLPVFRGIVFPQKIEYQIRNVCQVECKKQNLITIKHLKSVEQSCFE